MLNTFNDSMHQSILSVVSANTTVFIDRHDAAIEELEKELAIVSDDIIELQNNHADMEYDINLIKAEQENAGRMLSSIADTQLITDNNVAGLTERANTEFAVGLSFEVDPNTYVLALKLHNSNGVVIAEKSVDLPLESVVVDGGFDETTSEIVLTLQNGNEIRFPVSNIVGGFVSDKEFGDFLATKGQANGFAGLDASGKVPREQLPDDIGTGGTGTGGTGNADTSKLVKYTDFKIPYGLYSDGKDIYIASASKAEIDDKTSSYKAIATNLVEYATMKSLTDVKDDTLWTDEDKSAACETIGAVKKSTAVTTRPQLYMKNPDGTNKTVDATSDAGSSTVPLYNPQGKLSCTAPIANSHTVNKAYADANFVKVPAYGNATGAIIRYSDGSTTGVNVAAAGQISTSDIVRYSSTGTLAANDPVNAKDVVNKQYAEANFVPIPALFTSGEYRLTAMGKNSTGEYVITSIDVVNYGSTPTNAAIIRASIRGNITVADPVNATDAATKQYVDAQSIKPTTPTAASVITIGTDGAISTLQYAESDIVNTLPIRKANGCIACRTGTQSNEATTKGYVDTAITNNARIPSTINISIIGQDYDSGKVGIKLSLTNSDYNEITDFLSLCDYLYNHDIYSINNAVPAYGTITLTNETEIKFIGCAYGVQSFLTLVNADGRTFTLSSLDVAEQLDKYQQT